MPLLVLDVDISEWANEGSAVARDISEEGSSEMFSGICFVGEDVGLVSEGPVVDTIVSIISSVETYAFVGFSVNTNCVGSFVDWVGIEDFPCGRPLLGLPLPSVGNDAGLIVCSSFALALTQNWSSTRKHSQPNGQLLFEHGIDLVLQFVSASI